MTTHPVASTTVLELPVRRLPLVYHVGRMDPAAKSKFSHEGASLSVSLDPDAWREIARGQVTGQTYQIQTGTSEPLTFIDAHALNHVQRAAIEAWALETGRAERSTVYRVETTDEDGEPQFMSFLDRHSAEIEVQGLDPLNEDGYPILTEHAIVLPTAAVFAKHGHPRVEPGFAADFLLLEFAEEAGSYTGVWWDDDHDPARLSCPRGGILPNQLAQLMVLLGEPEETFSELEPSP